MDTLGKRLKHVISHYGMTMTSFAEKLSISQSMISKICKDNANPSDRTISDICRIYCINKEWLLNGTGEMIDTSSCKTPLADKVIRECAELISNAVCEKDHYVSETEIAPQIKEASPNDPELAQNLASVLSRIPTKLWPILTEIAKMLAEHSISAPADNHEAFIAGYEIGVKARKIMDLAVKDEPAKQ